MNIVIVGAGNVGRALGSGWLKTGHKVTMAVREPTSSKAIELKKRLLVPVHHRLRLLTFPMRTTPHVVRGRAVAMIASKAEK